MTDRPATETTEADVVVVGGGGAGLFAALAAAEAGARTVLLEKNPELGGTTLRAVGSITATGTRLQAAAGIADSPDGHFHDLALFNREAVADADARDNPDLRRLLVEAVPETVRRLEELGVVFFGPMPEPPHGKPRMHNVLPHARSFIHHLARHARRAGVDIRLGVGATGLIQDGGRVGGVSAEVGGEPCEFAAARGVVLAAGDYSASRELKERYLGAEMAAIEAVNPTSTGDGHAMGLAAGAELVNGDVMAGPEIRFVAPARPSFVHRLPPTHTVGKLVRLAMSVLPDPVLRPFLMMFLTTNLGPNRALFEAGAILVNGWGERFTDERAAPRYDIPKQPGGISYLVFDHKIATAFTAWPNFISTAPGVAYAYLADYRRNRKDITFEAPTPDALAVRLGVPAAALARTLAATTGPALDTPPYYALGPAKSWIAFTDGGLRVDTHLRVLGHNGEPIAGLYAAGSCGQGGVLLEGHGHHLAWAFTSGRLAGGYAAGG
jgi:fumarate reductase flavoprotein subunit